MAWADNGAPEGAAKDKPAPIVFPNGWNIKPDMVIEMPKDFTCRRAGTINYQNILVKVNFPEDKWVVAAEMRPGNPQVVHHMRGSIFAGRVRTGWRMPCPESPYEAGDE